MTRTPPPPRGGIAGLLYLFCFAGAAAGLGFDFGLDARPDFWIAAQPGAVAALGAGAALIVVLGARVAQTALKRGKPEGGRDAGGHP